MNIAELPFNRLIGLQRGPAEGDDLMVLDAGPPHGNHLGTIHACALLAVAEAGAGEFLLRTLGDASHYIPVVRRLEAKFRKPAVGRIAARAQAAPETIAQWKHDLATRGRLLAAVAVEVVDAENNVALAAEVEWFITRRPT